MIVIGTLITKLKLMKDPIAYWRSKGATIGKDCEIYSSAVLGSEAYLVSIGDHVRINSNVVFVTHDGGVWVLRNMDAELKNADIFGKIRVGNNVHIGTGAVVMPGVTVGNNCIIGVGAVVTRDIPDNSIAVGIPARVIKTVDEYLEQHRAELFFTKNMTSDEKKAFLLKNLEKIK